MNEAPIIEVTQSDIECARKYQIDNPILCAMIRLTGTCWRLLPGGVLAEVTPPYRSLSLDAEARKRWCDYSRSQQMVPFRFRAAFILPHETDAEDTDKMR